MAQVLLPLLLLDLLRLLFLALDFVLEAELDRDRERDLSLVFLAFLEVEAEVPEEVLASGLGVGALVAGGVSFPGGGPPSTKEP